MKFMSSLTKMLNAINTKDRAYYDQLPEEEQKKFAAYLAMRWASCSNGDADLVEYWLRATNQMANIGLFELHRHPKLQWLLVTVASPGISTRHEWIKGPSRSKNIPFAKTLEKLYPTMKHDEIQLMAKMHTKSSVRTLLREHGWQEDEIKRELK